MTTKSKYTLLDAINSPADLRALKPEQLTELADQLRSFLIGSVSRTGGHLAASLGTVELTAALHYVYNTPEDRIVWDVGHQTYAHKILTGRREQMASLRKQGGISGFPKREESPYDTFGVGHSSTSISAALGMAVAAAKQESHRQVVAVIGDGALSAGMAFEALNNAGDMDANLLVILNDNDMSISNNVGGMSNHLARILSSKVYSGMRKTSKSFLSRMGPLWRLARRTEEHMKGMVMPSTLFEELGFNYIGPMDGHDIRTLVRTLNNMKELKGPQFLHVITKKGKGFEPAEDDPCVYHGVGPFNPETGKIEPRSGKKTYTQVFSDWLCDAANNSPDLMAITPAMREGSGLVKFSEQFPDRYFDVGIAEQHAVTFAAGLATEGLRPVVAIYSTFLQRAYDQAIHDVCLQNLPVTFAIDRAGLVGEDGPTHTGNFDISFMRCIPNLTLMAPADEQECRLMLNTAFALKGPAAVRYPRGSGPGVAVSDSLDTLPVGKAEVRRSGKKIALLAFGTMVAAAEEAGEALDATVVNMRFIKPLDEALIQQLTQGHSLLVTIEENTVAGGAGSAINEYLVRAGIEIPVINLGLPDAFPAQGSRAQLLTDCGLDAAGIQRTIRRSIPIEVAAVPNSA